MHHVFVCTRIALYSKTYMQLQPHLMPVMPYTATFAGGTKAQLTTWLHAQLLVYLLECMLSAEALSYAEFIGSPESVYIAFKPHLRLWDFQAPQHGHQVWSARPRSLQAEEHSWYPFLSQHSASLYCTHAPAYSASYDLSLDLTVSQCWFQRLVPYFLYAAIQTGSS